MFSHVDGWEKSAVIATIGGGAVLAAAIPSIPLLSRAVRGSANCGNCENPLQKSVARTSGVPSSGAAC